MTDPSPKLDPEFEVLVRQYIQPNEVVLGWDNQESRIVIWLIDRELNNRCALIANEFGGMGAGCGRTLEFKQLEEKWTLVTEGMWIS